MSDLITTTRDAGREAAIATYFGVRRAGRALAERAKDPTGQTAAEYMGVLLLVAMIISAIVLLHVPDNIAKAINGLVDNISKGDNPKGGTAAPAATPG
jgi:hypothetical protein